MAVEKRILTDAMQTFRIEAESLAETAKVLDAEAFGRAVEVLSKAPRIAAAAEILIVGATPVRCVRTSLDILLGHIPERLHAVLSLCVSDLTATVHCGSAAVDQVDESVPGFSGRLFTGHALAGFRTPVGSHIMETGRGIRHQSTKQHRQTVERIVFGCKCGRGFRAVPVKG